MNSSDDKRIIRRALQGSFLLVSLWKLFHGTAHDGIEDQLIGAPRLAAELWAESKQHHLPVPFGHAHHGWFSCNIRILTHRPATHQQTGVPHYADQRKRLSTSL